MISYPVQAREYLLSVFSVRHTGPVNIDEESGERSYSVERKEKEFDSIFFFRINYNLFGKKRRGQQKSKWHLVFYFNLYF